MSTSLTTPAPTEQIHRTRLAIFPSDTPDGAPLVATIKLTAKGMIKSAHTQVVLTEKSGQVYEVQGKKKPTIDGYRHLNQFRGVKIVEPDYLIDEAGKRHPNPYFERDAHGSIRRVTCKKIGIGRDTLGNFAVFSQTLEFDLHVYFVQDLMKKWTGYQNSPAKGWGTLYDAERIPAEVLNDGTKKVVYTAEGTALVVDLSHAEVQGVINQHTSRWKFVGRMADSICERRILSKFIPVGQLVPAGDGKFYVPIVSWPDCEQDFEEWRDLAISAADGDSGQLIEGQAVSVESASAAPTAEEFDHGVEDVDEETGDAPAPTPTPGVDVPSPASPAVGPTTEVQQADADHDAQHAAKPSFAELQERIAMKIQRLDFDVADKTVSDVTKGKANAGNAADVTHRPTLIEIDKRLSAAIESAKQPSTPAAGGEDTKASQPGGMF